MKHRCEATSLSESDAQFLRALEACELPNAQFRHRDHLRAAWLYLSCYGQQRALVKMDQTIRRFAAHHGQHRKFHATLTTLWVRLVAAHTATDRWLEFDDFIAANGELLDKHLPLRFYTPQRLFSDLARAAWIEPDVRRIPTT